MTRPIDIPYAFAVLRTDRVQGPCLQFLRCTLHHLRDGSPAYSVETVSWAEEMHNERYEEMDSSDYDPRIYTFHHRSFSPQARSAQEYKFWFLPFYYRRNNIIIPVVEFQFKSWLPSHFPPIPIRNDQTYFLRVFDEIHAERISDLHNGEHLQRGTIEDFENSFQRFRDYHYFRQRRQVPYSRNEQRQRSISPDWDTRYRTPSPPRRNRRRDTIFDNAMFHNPRLLPEVVTPIAVIAPPPAPSQPAQIIRVPLALPSEIGRVLLSHARKTADSCPIAATPFTDCSRLCVSSCFHIFDAESLSTWQQTHNTCPVCRTQLTNVVTEDTAIVTP